MSYYNWQEEAVPAPQAFVNIQEVLRWVYLWMGFGLLVTAGVAFLTVGSETLTNLLMTPGVILGAIIAELVLVFALSAAITRLSPAAAAVMFFVYAALNGFTLSVIFWAYTGGTITAAFVATAALFGAMTVVGFTTQLDLTRMGTYLMMGVLGLVVAMLVNIFLGSSGLDMIISMGGVLIFTGLTAYDTQKIKVMASDPNVQADGNVAMKLSIMGALRLYLDFINMFIFLLRILGGRRR